MSSGHDATNKESIWILQKNLGQPKDHTDYNCQHNNSPLYDQMKVLNETSDIYSTDNCPRHSTYRDKKPKPVVPVAQSPVVLFCEAISIRGMQKIARAPNKFLRSVWIGFVLLMTLLLLVTSYFLVGDFFNYNTAWHTSTAFDEKTEFPAISICSHNPFSVNANKMWRENSVLTPKQFEELLTKVSINMVNRTQFGTEVLYDSAENYYGNIDYEASLNLSHKEDILRYCVLTTDAYAYIAEGCNIKSYITSHVRKFSNNKYFNCFTIEEDRHQLTSEKTDKLSTSELLSIIVLIQITPESDLNYINTSFVMDTLTRGTGIKIVLHEVGTSPEIENYGINLQPGKMNEISFETIHWNRFNSPKRPCMNNQSDIVDLGTSYKYTMSKCVESELQKITMKNCGCMNTNWPRPVKPSQSIPYCTNFSCSIDELIKRYGCSTIKDQGLSKQNLVDTKCFGVCSYFTYDTKVSVTNWKPSLYKLNRITQLYNIVNEEFNKTDSGRQEHIEKLQQKPKYKATKTLNMLSDEARFTYINVVRKTFDTIKKKEKLVIDVSIFISRVGGLCSLFIGLTTAVFAELIEFFYLAFHKN